jgi:hypothetical protein
MQNPELQSAEILGKKGENCEKPNHNNCRNSEVPLQPLLVIIGRSWLVGLYGPLQ